MKIIPLVVNSSGFVYDPAQPTINTERLSYVNLQILDALSVGGYEYRQAEASDVVAVDGVVKSYVDSVRGQNVGSPSVEYPALTSDSSLLVPGAVNALVNGRVQAALLSEEKEPSGGVPVDLQALIDKIEEVRALLDVLCNREEILNIGSHVVWTKSACVDEL